MASRGKGARQKGFQFERDIAKYMTIHTGIEFARGLGQTRGGGGEIPDVTSPEVPWLHLETKRQKRVSIKAAMAQATGDARPGAAPTAITKDDRGPIFVTMLLDDWIELVNAKLTTLQRDSSD